MKNSPYLFSGTKSRLNCIPLQESSRHTAAFQQKSFSTVYKNHFYLIKIINLVVSVMLPYCPARNLGLLIRKNVFSFSSLLVDFSMPIIMTNLIELLKNK